MCGKDCLKCGKYLFQCCIIKRITNSVERIAYRMERVACSVKMIVM